MVRGAWALTDWQWSDSGRGAGVVSSCILSSECPVSHWYFQTRAHNWYWLKVFGEQAKENAMDMGKRFVKRRKGDLVRIGGNKWRWRSVSRLHDVRSKVSMAMLGRMLQTKWILLFLCKQHQEFSFLLKERVCPLVIKLFSPNIKFRQGSSTSSSPAPVEKPYFPICMRLLRVVSVLIKQFYSLLVSVSLYI